MGILMLSLLGFSILLLFISLLQKDPYKELREEIDQLTMQHVQELYQVKKKLKILEEELLINSDDFATPPFSTNKRNIHKIIKSQVWALAQQGKPIEQIASQSSLAAEEVYAILEEFSQKGKQQ